MSSENLIICDVCKHIMQAGKIKKVIEENVEKVELTIGKLLKDDKIEIYKVSMISELYYFVHNNTKIFPFINVKGVYWCKINNENFEFLISDEIELIKTFLIEQIEECSTIDRHIGVETLI